MKLSAWRAKHGLLMIEAAERLGIDQSLLSRLESASKIDANRRTASLGLCLDIERRTHGEVKAEELPQTKATKLALKLLRGPSGNAESAA